MIHLRLKVQLTLIGPILTQSTSAGRLGLDAVMARTVAGHPYLPYSQVRGKLRQALEELADPSGGADQATIAKFVPVWFGPRQGRNNVDLERGSLNFSDFVHPVPKDDSSTRTRIRVDSDTGAAQEKMIMVLDSPFEVGEEAKFVGEIWSVCNSVEQAEATAKYVLAGLRWIRQIGAERTLGFGRVRCVEVVELTISELAIQSDVVGEEIRKHFDVFIAAAQPHRQVSLRRAASSASHDQDIRHLLRIRPRGSFCLGGIRRADNLFDSEEAIPGGAILGTLATMWRQASGLPATQYEVAPDGGPWNKLAEHFTKLVITHAFPSRQETNTRPCAIPLSFVAAEPWSADIPDRLYDVALCTRPRLIPVGDTSRPPVFQPDWKTHVVGKKAKAMSGWTDIPRELRVRTAIDVDTLRAVDKHLFAYQMIIPDGYEWFAYLDLHDVPSAERGEVLAELKQLLAAGLGPIGKTKIDADVCIEPVTNVAPKWASDPEALPGNQWVVTLQTSAVLCTGDDLRDPTGERLKKGYDTTWSELSGGSLRLRQFFARQSLSAPRFAGRLPKNAADQYYPFVLTDAGSTFVLEATADKALAQAKIEEWLARGIPVREKLLSGTATDPDWQRCPYLNRHGYGEITVNPPWLRGELSDEMPLRLEDEAS